MLANPREGFAWRNSTKNKTNRTGRETKDTNDLFGFCSILEQAVF